MHEHAWGEETKLFHLGSELKDRADNKIAGKKTALPPVWALSSAGAQAAAGWPGPCLLFMVHLAADGSGWPRW